MLMVKLQKWTLAPTSLVHDMCQSGSVVPRAREIRSRKGHGGHPFDELVHVCSSAYGTLKRRTAMIHFLWCCSYCFRLTQAFEEFITVERTPEWNKWTRRRRSSSPLFLVWCASSPKIKDKWQRPRLVNSFTKSGEMEGLVGQGENSG